VTDIEMPGVWMIDQKRWAVTRSETSFDPTDLQGQVGYIIQGTDRKWSIESDPNGQRYDVAEKAAQELIRFRSTDGT
jgi:hypothetical protein